MYYNIYSKININQIRFSPNQILTCLPKIYDIIAKRTDIYCILSYCISELLHAFKLIIYCVFIDCGFSSMDKQPTIIKSNT